MQYKCVSIQVVGWVHLHIITWHIVSLACNVLAALSLLRHVVGAVVYRVRVGFVVVVHEGGRHGLHLAGRLMEVLQLVGGRLPRIRVIQ